jgi:hypothetical protein
MKQNSIIIIFLLLGITCNSLSQVAKEDFARINKIYAEHPRISVKMKYEVFKNRSAVTALSSETGEVKKKEGASYDRIGPIETITNKEYKLIVDHDDKNISILGILQGEKSSDKDLYPVDLEKLIGVCEKVEFKKLNEKQACYTMTIPGTGYEEVKMIYNTTSFLIEKLILYSNEKQNLENNDGGAKETPRMEITYSDYQTEPDLKNTPFTYGAFLEKKEGKLVAKPAYQTYTVHEQLFK